jgi:UDPglucose--hexose-1-phosphate uridylyltransferase
MQTEFLTKNCLRLLEVTAKREVEDQSRVVCQNEDWVWLIPYWAVWPFEILLLPRFEARRLSDLNQDQTENLAKVLKEGLTAYDLLFDTSFPYSMGWHQCPSGLSAKEEEAFTLHAHFYPPLLRSATIKKFMVGYEMLGESQRDLTPELAAERLRRAMDSGQS